MRSASLAAVLAAVFSPGLASAQSPVIPRGWEEPVPELSSLVSFDRGQSDLRVAVDRFSSDRSVLGRRYDVDYSPVARERLERFYTGWGAALAGIDFGSLNLESQIDHVLLQHQVEYELALLEERERHEREMHTLLPFSQRIQRLQLNRRERLDVDAQAAAQELAEMATEVQALTRRLGGPADSAADLRSVTPVVAYRSADHVRSLRRTLDSWFGFYNGYDPLFTWWAAEPYKKADQALGVGLRDFAVGEVIEAKAAHLLDAVFMQALRLHHLEEQADVERHHRDGGRRLGDQRHGAGERAVRESSESERNPRADAE